MSNCVFDESAGNATYNSFDLRAERRTSRLRDGSSVGRCEMFENREGTVLGIYRLNCGNFSAETMAQILVFEAGAVIVCQ